MATSTSELTSLRRRNLVRRTPPGSPVPWSHASERKLPGAGDGRARSDPPVRFHLAVALGGPVRSDGDDLHAVRTRLETTHDMVGNAQDVSFLDVDHLVAEL